MYACHSVIEMVWSGSAYQVDMLLKFGSDARDILISIQHFRRQLVE